MIIIMLYIKVILCLLIMCSKFNSYSFSIIKTFYPLKEKVLRALFIYQLANNCGFCLVHIVFTIISSLFMGDNVTVFWLYFMSHSH